VASCEFFDHDPGAVDPDKEEFEEGEGEFD
jgi:hypothetical protein